MILEAKYIGPYPEVTVPGFERKTCKRGETVKIRVRDGFPLGGCWEIIKGETEYKAALGKMAKEQAAKKKAKEAKAAKTAEIAEAAADAADPDLKPKPSKKGASK